MSHRVAVCSWSLRARSPRELAERVDAAGVRHVQLALDPLRTGDWGRDATVRALEERGIGIVSGMMAAQGEDYSSLETIARTGGVRPDKTWRANHSAARENAQLARELGLHLVTFHAGFLPDDRAHPEHDKLLDRVRSVVDVFAEQGVRIGLETGQETARTLDGFLAELGRPTAGVNFDPANMLLYGKGDPVEALDLLHTWVRQVHVKDARAATTRGAWGEEVPVGTGEVDWSAFFGVLRRRELGVDLVIEREAGDDRVDDVATARELVEQHLARGARA